MMSGAGAGLLFFPKSIVTLAQSQMNSAVVIAYEDNNSGCLGVSIYDQLYSQAEWADVIAIGPGLGKSNETKEVILKLIGEFKNKSFVIDADAISALSELDIRQMDLSGNILTPHHGEFANLLNISVDKLQTNIIGYGKEFSSQTNSYLVLKGAPTLIFSPSGDLFVNSSGNPGLAKFGSGDVLTGIIASFLSQTGEIEQSVLSAVYCHGLSADLIVKEESEFGVTPNKLIDNIPNTIKFLRKSIV